MYKYMQYLEGGKLIVPLTTDVVATLPVFTDRAPLLFWNDPPRYGYPEKVRHHGNPTEANL